MISSTKFLLPACAVWSIGTAFAGEKVSTADYQSLIKAFDNARQEFRSGADAKPNAYNKRQNWVTQLDEQGFIVHPRGRNWTWGLGLKSWGSAGAEQSIGAQTIGSYQTQGNRVTYGHSGQLEEWYLNDQRGLEHGFTVKEKPAGDAKALDFRLSVRGSLKPQLDGNHIEFVDSAGTERLTYSGLKAWDAKGRMLATNFKVEKDDLVIQVDSSDAQYPITVDPVAEDVSQQSYLKAENAGNGDYFGYSVAVDGDLAVVGAPYEDSSSKGVDGDNGDSTLGTDSGAVYVFIRSGTTWTTDAYIKPSVNTTLDYFGCSVDISGETIVVGSYGRDASTTQSFSGAAYVFTYDSTDGWVQKSILTATEPYLNGYFGFSVAIDGDRLVVGSPGESSKVKVVNGDESDHSLANAGAAYVFNRVTSGNRVGTWTKAAYLKPSLNAAANQFGYSVGISGDTVIVGAPFESTAGTGIDPVTTTKKSASSGAAFLFTYSTDSSSWLQAAAIKASNASAGDSFGYSVAIDGNTAVVGSPKEASSSTGVNGLQNDKTKTSGAVYIYSRVSENWSQEAFLKPSNTGSGDLFGYSVKIDGSTIVVGAPLEDGSGKGINPSSNDSKKDSGAAYVFEKNGETWYQESYLKASNTDAGDYFGVSVDISAGTVIAGARAEDSSSTSIGGSQTNAATTVGSQYGAAYVFTGFSTDILPSLYVENQETAAVTSGSTDDFGLLIAKKSLKRTYTVKNTGTAAMSFTATLSANAAPFTMSDPKLKTLLPGESTTFVVTFAPKLAGEYAASVTINSSDPSNSVFTLQFTGDAYVPTPEIQVFGPESNELTDGADTISWPVTAIGTSSSYTFTVKNTGTGDLTGVSVAIKGGTGAKSYKVTAKPASKVVIGGQTTFTVTFTPKLDGTYPTALQIKSNDADEKVFDVNITGSTTAAP